MAVPLLGQVWQFWVIKALGDSFENEYRAQGLSNSPIRTRGLGNAQAVVHLLAFLHFATASILFFPTDPESGVPVSAFVGWLYVYSLLASIPLLLAGIILWAVSWSTLATLSGDLQRRRLARQWRVRVPRQRQ